MKNLITMQILVFLSIIGFSSFSCTSIFVGKDATVNGSVIVSHSDDALDDPRVFYFKAEDHKPGSKVPIYYQNAALGFLPEFGGVPYRLWVTNEKNSPYNTGETLSVPLGSIPQVPKTYAYFRATYPIMNEHQLSIGETTCDAKVEPLPEAGKRIFYSSQLAEIALQRCKEAKEAVLLMGELIDKYGYYGTGEAMFVADKNEGWLMEMCGYDENGIGGLWVAQRIPDNAVSVSANYFRIREVKENDSNFLYSKYLFTICEKLGWWNPKDGNLDWLKAVSPEEGLHTYSAFRRVWRIYSLAKPSANYSPWISDTYSTYYPVSIVPDKKLSVKDILGYYRDNYQNTEFDMTKGIAAGPFGNPLRSRPPKKMKSPETGKEIDLKGGFERPLNVIKTTYYHINELRSKYPDEIGGIIWYGFDTPSTSCVMPIYAGVNKIPKSFTNGNYTKYNPKSAWWIFNNVKNIAMLMYSHMITDIKKKQESIEDYEFGIIPTIDQTALSLYNSNQKELMKKFLTEFSCFNAQAVVKEWKKLRNSLYVKCNDGFIVDEEGNITEPEMSYNWLEKSGYLGALQDYKKPKSEN